MGTLGGEEDEKEEPATERRREYTDLGLDLGEREEQIVRPAYFTNCIFPVSGPPGFRLAFDAAERNGRWGRIQCQRSNRAAEERERDKYSSAEGQ